MGLRDNINREFPFQVALSLDDKLDGVLDWRDDRIGAGTWMSISATTPSAIASAILPTPENSEGASSFRRPDEAQGRAVAYCRVCRMPVTVSSAMLFARDTSRQHVRLNYFMPARDLEYCVRARARFVAPDPS
jgi:hypothetical protein